MPHAPNIHDRIDRTRFWSLPQPLRGDGQPRRTGVEIEFAGLDEVAAAACVQRLWGGALRQSGESRLTLAGSRHGEVSVERDTALAAEGAEGLVRDLLGDLVPVEIVTAPLPHAALPDVDALVVALRRAGARGTRDALAYGFGLHLNPEIAAPDAGFVLPVVRAYGLLEDWLRAGDPIDTARRLLPFVDPWPRVLIDALADEAAFWDLAELAEAYLALTPSRNRGLDLLPLLMHLVPERVQAALPEGQAKGGRPTFHYRLPEARIDEPRWTVAYEWNRWCIVERVAARPALLKALAAAWRGHRAAYTTVRGDWALQVERRLRAARIWQP